MLPKTDIMVAAHVFLHKFNTILNCILYTTNCMCLCHSYRTLVAYGLRNHDALRKRVTTVHACSVCPTLHYGL